MPNPMTVAIKAKPAPEAEPVQFQGTKPAAKKGRRVQTAVERE